MNTSTLQQFLRTLISPLKAIDASEQTVTDVERMLDGLEPFADKPVGEFAAFLVRAHGYERNGHWPSSRPPIQGEIVDRPSPADYADRLKVLVQREVTANGVVPEVVFTEFKALQATLKLPQLKEMALACGVSGSLGNAAAVVKKTFEHLTRRKFEDALLQMYHDRLSLSRGNQQQLEGELAKAKGTLGGPQLKKLAKQLGISGKPRNADEAMSLIREALGASSIGHASPVSADSSAQPVLADDSAAKLGQIAETLRELKRKADPEGAAYEEVEEELTRLEATMTAEQAIAAAKQIGVEWSVHTRPEALKRIREKVFERKRIREKIQH